MQKQSNSEIVRTVIKEKSEQFKKSSNLYDVAKVTDLENGNVLASIENSMQTIDDLLRSKSNDSEIQRIRAELKKLLNTYELECLVISGLITPSSIVDFSTISFTQNIPFTPTTLFPEFSQEPDTEYHLFTPVTKKRSATNNGKPSKEVKINSSIGAKQKPWYL